MVTKVAAGFVLVLALIHFAIQVTGYDKVLDAPQPVKMGHF